MTGAVDGAVEEAAATAAALMNRPWRKKNLKIFVFFDEKKII